ncbi:enoyl-CoA hydratase [Solibacillus sp. CAU 1738]|uniref:enoyl-CoA hydratase n=1 Tax=Solibacillus sp. CAU 1738 TaxID=3140363 RepID=UPI00325FEE7C
MGYTTIELEVLERKAVLTLNRPHAMNAMDFTMMKELANCFEALHKEKDVQVLIIKGAGRVFSAGGDVKAMVGSNDFADFGEIMDDITRLAVAYYTLPMITISQVHGAAAGLGFSLVLGSDIIVAEETAKLAMNFIGIGLIPDGGGHFHMQERVGTVKAKQMIWEGKVMNGKEALAQGLIDYNVPEDAAATTVDQIVGKLLASPIAAMLETKQILHAEKLPELERILQGEANAQSKMRNSKDHQEGIQAFVEKRMPEFIGK